MILYVSVTYLFILIHQKLTLLLENIVDCTLAFSVILYCSILYETYFIKLQAHSKIHPSTYAGLTEAMPYNLDADFIGRSKEFNEDDFIQPLLVTRKYAKFQKISELGFLVVMLKRISNLSSILGKMNSEPMQQSTK
jgi:hypothetical protein